MTNTISIPLWISPFNNYTEQVYFQWDPDTSLQGIGYLTISYYNEKVC